MRRVQSVRALLTALFVATQVIGVVPLLCDHTKEIYQRAVAFTAAPSEAIPANAASDRIDPDGDLDDDCCALLREGVTIGLFVLMRRTVRPFTEQQIELVSTFADQAVIAIENVRLLDELRARTDQLAGSVQELQALGEVSQAVNSTLDLETVLTTIVAKAVQLSGTEAGAIYVFENEQREFHLRATYGMDHELIEALTQRHIGLDAPNITPAFLEGEPIQVPDLHEGSSSAANEIILRAGFRALLVTPLVRGEEIVGMLVWNPASSDRCSMNTSRA